MCRFYIVPNSKVSSHIKKGYHQPNERMGVSECGLGVDLVWALVQIKIRLCQCKFARARARKWQPSLESINSPQRPKEQPTQTLSKVCLVANESAVIVLHSRESFHSQKVAQKRERRADPLFCSFALSLSLSLAHCLSSFGLPTLKLEPIRARSH